MPIGDHRSQQKQGTLEYGGNSSLYNSYQMPAVQDPGAAYEQIMRTESADYMADYGAFEEALVQARQDTSLIDAAPEVAATQTRLAGEIAERNRQRYGYNQTAVEESEAERSLQRQGALSLAGGLTNARVAQKEQNYQTMAGLINIGSDSYSQNIGALSSASAGYRERQEAYKNARAQQKASTVSTVASLGSAAIMAFAFGI